MIKKCIKYNKIFSCKSKNKQYKREKKIYYLLEQIMISNYLLDVLMLFQKKNFLFEFIMDEKRVNKIIKKLKRVNKIKKNNNNNKNK